VPTRIKWLLFSVIKSIIVYIVKIGCKPTKNKESSKFFLHFFTKNKSNKLKQKLVLGNQADDVLKKMRAPKHHF
jgi:hypothetical protein